MTDIDAVRAAVAGGWCVPPNTEKEMDAELGEAIVQALIPILKQAHTDGMREAARIADRHYAAGDMGNPGHHIMAALEDDHAAQTR